jgi:hypothetical protein
VTRTPAEAVEWGESVDSGYNGLCLQFSRDCYLVGPLYSCADADWYGTGTRHETSNPDAAPFGALLHFYSPTSPQYGHIALNEGGGYMLTTSDSHGGPTVMRVSDWTSWGYRLRGWKSRINDVEVLNTGGGGGGGGDKEETPSYVNLTDATDRTFPADGQWYALSIQADSPRYNLLTGPAWIDGQVSVTVALDGGREVDVRAITVDTQDDGNGQELVSAWPAGETFTVGGQTQIVFPFTQHVSKAAVGWKRRLRFQIKAWGGGTVKILSAGARGVYWE